MNACPEEKGTVVLVCCVPGTKLVVIREITPVEELML